MINPQQMLGNFRCSQRTSLPRLCVVIVVAMGLLVLADLVPRMVIVTSQPRETAYWEAWEEAYVDRRAPLPQLCLTGMAQCAALWQEGHMELR